MMTATPVEATAARNDPDLPKFATRQPSLLLDQRFAQSRSNLGDQKGHAL